MNIRKVVQGVHDVVRSENPGEAAGKIVRAGVTAAHPVVGLVGGHFIEKGTAAAVNKGIEIAKNPEVQAKVKQVGADVGHKAIEIGGEAARAARRGAGSAVARIQAFRAGHGR